MLLDALRDPRGTALALRGGHADAPEVASASARILDAVARDGTAAVLRFTAQFDAVKLAESELRLPRAVTEHARALAKPELLEAIRRAYADAERLAKVQRASIRDGEGLRWIPRESVGFYLRRGARFDARAFAARVALARVAGAKRLFAASAPSLSPTLPGGYGVDARILASCAELGVELFLAGGAQGMAQLARWAGEDGVVLGLGGSHARAAARILAGHFAVELPPMAPSLLLADSSVEAAEVLAAAEGVEVALALDDGAADLLGRAAEASELRAYRASRDQALVFAQALAPPRVVFCCAEVDRWRGELTQAGALVGPAHVDAPALPLMMRAQTLALPVLGPDRTRAREG